MAHCSFHILVSLLSINMINSTTQLPSRDPIAFKKANTLLQAMSETFNNQSVENINDYVDSKFVYKKCEKELNKDSSLGLISNYPNKNGFTFSIIDAHFADENLIYKVTIKDFGPMFTAIYNATSDESLQGKYRLLNGEELSCQIMEKL